MEALAELERNDATILGWEGWLRYPDGRVGHSAEHQGTADMSALDAGAAYEYCRNTIREAHAQFSVRPERSADALLFCITHDV